MDATHSLHECKHKVIHLMLLHKIKTCARADSVAALPFNNKTNSVQHAYHIFPILYSVITVDSPLAFFNPTS